MSEEPSQAPPPDPLFVRVSETSMRMFAGVVPPKTTSELHRVVEQAGGGEQGYPWEQVVDRVLADPADPEDLVRRSLRAQRDWLAVGGGAKKPGLGARASRAGKGFLARAIGRLIAFSMWLVLAVVLLLVLRIRFPEVDIYRLLDLLPAGATDEIRRLLGG
jgi:uncharacterized membrane protein